MSKLEFEEENVSSFKSRVILGEPQPPRLVTFLIRKGIVKSGKQAEIFLLSLIAVCLIVSLIFITKFVVPKKAEIIILKNVVITPPPQTE